MKIKRLMVGMIGTNCFLVKNEDSGEGFIVDPGGEPDRIHTEAIRMGMKPAAILLTHGHEDHIEAVPDLVKKLGLTVYALEGEKNLLADPSLNLTAEFTGTRGFGVTADRWLRDGETFTLAGYEIHVIATPGHTEGSCCFYIPDADVLFSGDTLFEQSYGRTDLPTGNTMALIHSITEKLFTLPEETQVFPGHMGSTTIGEEKKYNPLAGYRGWGFGKL